MGLACPFAEFSKRICCIMACIWAIMGRAGEFCQLPIWNVTSRTLAQSLASSLLLGAPSRTFSERYNTSTKYYKSPLGLLARNDLVKQN